MTMPTDRCPSWIYHLTRELREHGIAEALINGMACPVGLPIGSNDPQEIAISIAAQLLERRGR